MDTVVGVFLAQARRHEPGRATDELRPRRLRLLRVADQRMYAAKHRTTGALGELSGRWSA